MKKIAADKNYRVAQYVESDGRGQSSAEIVPGPPQRPGAGWKNWMPETKPGVGPSGGSFLEGYDVSTSTSYTARELLKVMEDAHYILTSSSIKKELSPSQQEESSKLKAAIRELSSLIDDSSSAKYVMYLK